MAYSQIENRFLDSMAEAQFPTTPEPAMPQEQPKPDPILLAEAGSRNLPESAYTGQTQARIQEIPRNKFQEALGKFGELLQSGADAVDFDVIGLPGIGSLTLKDLTVGDLGKVLQDISYGFYPVSGGNVATGGIGTYGLKADPVMEILNATPLAGSLAKAGGKGVAKIAGKVVSALPTDLPVGMSIKGVGEISDALLMPVKIGERELKIPADQAAVLQKAIKNLTPAEQAKFRSDTAIKFVNILQDLPSTKEFAAAAIGGKAKKGWYEGSTQAILEVFGPDAPRFAALLSATSPQTSVESNLFNALQIWKNWTAAGRPVDRESIVKVMGQSVQGNKGEESVLDAWINNSVAALSADDPAKVVLSGPKVNSFMLNLQGNVNEVTNDAWMAAFSLVDQKLFAGSLTKGGDPGKGPGYLAMNARVRETATYLTKLTGETWTPAEVQETIWSWAKTLYEKAGSAGENRNAVQLIKDNAITDELIASTPDFRTLFYDQRFQPILEQSGYADQLARLREATGGVDVPAGGQKPGAGGKAGALDPEAQRKLNERNARRLDNLRKQREQAAAAKAQEQNPTGGVE